METPNNVTFYVQGGPIFNGTTPPDFKLTILGMMWLVGRGLGPNVKLGINRISLFFHLLRCNQ